MDKQQFYPEDFEVKYSWPNGEHWPECLSPIQSVFPSMQITKSPQPHPKTILFVVVQKEVSFELESQVTILPSSILTTTSVHTLHTTMIW